jgi:hypothetical protein
MQAKLPPGIRVTVEKPEKGSKNRAPPLVVLFRDRVSTRGVELLEGDDSITARMPAFAPPEDLTLALQVAQLAGEELGSDVETIDGVFKPGEVFSEKLAEPIARAQSGDLSALNAAVTKGATQTLPGAMRPFFLGPRVYEELRASTSQQGPWDNVVAKFREVQWAHLRGYHPATIIGLRKGNNDFTASAWAPGQAVLFQPVDMVLLKAVGQPVRLPWAGLRAVAGDRLKLLDERQVTVEAFSEDEWPEVISRAGNALGARN